MSKPEITTQIRIQSDSEYWYTVEDIYLDDGCDGLTISVWNMEDLKEERSVYVCIEKDAALSVADAIYKLFKKENSDG